jgi:hypothetical protein
MRVTERDNCTPPHSAVNVGVLQAIDATAAEGYAHAIVPTIALYAAPRRDDRFGRSDA